MRMDEEKVLKAMANYCLMECMRNEVIYGIFCLDKDIPEDVKGSAIQLVNPEKKDG